MTILVTLPSCMSCLTFSMRLSVEIENSSVRVFWVEPQLWQYFALLTSWVPHFQHVVIWFFAC